MFVSFENAYNNYLKYVEYRQKNQSIRTLKERFKDKILPYWKDLNIFEIKEKDYLEWQNIIETYKYSNNYKTNIHYLMTKFFDYLIIYYNLKENIPRKVGNFKLKNEVNNYNIYNYKEFKKFIKQFDNDMYKQFFNLLYFTGVRPGEAMALKFSDLNNKILSINKTIDEHYYKGIRQINTPKTYSSIRDIQIDRRLNKDLLSLKKYYINKYNSFNLNYYIFGGIKPLAPTTINRYKLKACEKCNLKPIKLHEFRHSHATLLVEKKLMIKEISRRLGHSNTNITLNIYTHATKEHEKKVIKTLNFIRFM